jgi:PAS domain S-box-containing protein
MPVSHPADQEKLIQYLDNVTDGVMMLDQEWRVLYINAVGARLSRHTPEQLLGKVLWSEFPEAMLQDSYRELMQVMQGNRPARLETYYPPLDAWFENDLYPHSDGLTSVFRDITARKRAEREQAELLGQEQRARQEADLLAQRLQKQREELEVGNEELQAMNEELLEREALLGKLRREAETISRIGQQLAAELDLDRLVTAVTDAVTRIAGAQFGALFYNVVNEQGESYTLYHISGVSRESFSQFPMPRNTAVFAPTFRGEGVVRLDDVTQDPRYGQNAPHYGMPKGHLPVRSYLAVPVISRSGEVIGGLFLGHSEPGVFRPEHERLVVGIAAQAATAIDNARLFQRVREAETDVRRQQRFRLAIENSMAAGIAVIDHEARQTYVNPAFCRLVGWSERELLGQQPPFLYWPPEEHDSIFEMFHRVLGGEVPASGLEMRQRRKNGTRFEALVLPSPLLSETGESEGWLVSVYDISDRKRAEVERERLLLQEKSARTEAESARVRAEQLSHELADRSRALEEAVAGLKTANADLERVGAQLREGQEEQQTASRLLRAANRAAARISPLEDEEAIFQVLLAALQGEMGSIAGGVWLRGKGKNDLQARVTFGLEHERPASLPEQFDMDLHSYKVAWVARYRRPFVGKIQTEDLQFDQEWARRHRVTSGALLPLVGRNGLHGVLAGYWREALPVQAGEVLAGLAASLTTALDTLALLRELQQARATLAERPD